MSPPSLLPFHPPWSISVLQVYVIRKPNLLYSQTALTFVINSYQDYGKFRLGRTTLTEHIIDTGSAVPIKQRHYPLFLFRQSMLSAELDKMLELGVVRPS